MKLLTTWWLRQGAPGALVGESTRRSFLQEARPWVGAAIGIALLVAVFRGIELPGLQRAWALADYRHLLAGGVFVLIGPVLRGLRWRLLFLPSRRPNTIKVTASVLAGQLVNLVVPLRAGELVRVYYLSELMGVSKVYTLSTIALERSLDGLVVVALALSLAPLIAFPGWFRWSGLASAAGFSVLFIILVFIARHRQALTGIVRRLLRLASALESLGVWRRLRPAADALDALAQPKLVLVVWALSVLIWLAGGLTNYLVLLSLGINLPFSASLFVLLTLAVGASVPALPWQVGVFESLAVLSLLPFGVDQTTGLAYGFLLHLVAYGPPTVLGVFCLRYLESARRRVVSEQGQRVEAEEAS